MQVRQRAFDWPTGRLRSAQQVLLPTSECVALFGEIFVLIVVGEASVPRATANQQ